MTTCKCSEMRWHPYPEEKPDVREGVFDCIMNIEYKPLEVRQCHWRNGRWRVFRPDGDGLLYANEIIAFAEQRQPYTPPVKKKTVRLSAQKLRDALNNTGWRLVPTAAFFDAFIEIEVDDET